ncbi:hypothetical protein HD597_003433 [Nonomuraea thailandensis]|uniref:WD40 repeat domain-containing protein n=1 Tax=Nonomuraea thailandensis TaxID=1188745 RepID=A0A9X2GLG5_9ACTN|nr:DUF6528 family protein [Nonomuraea thailandensis]MCP2356413.1 hypothetical protein [Nonomuraea thailandensis]
MRLLSMVAVMLVSMGAPAGPAAAAPGDYWVVGGDQTGRRLIAFDPAVADWNGTAAVRWAWQPSVTPGRFTADEVSAFGLIADFKLRERPSGAKSVVVAAGGSRGVAAVVSYPDGVRQWARILPGNLHAAELLPDGNLAVAASTGGWVRVYASSQGPDAATYAEYRLADAHAALWDPAIRRLWVIGRDSATAQPILTALAVEGTPARPTLREDTSRRAVLPTPHGHDVYGHAHDPGRLWLTTGSAAYLYDKITKTFIPAGSGASRGAVKSIGNQPSGQIVQTRADSAKTPPGSCTASTWCTDTVDFFGPAMTRRRTGAAFYKARVWSPYYGAEDRSLRGTVWGRTRGASGAWDASAARIDGNGGISGVAVAALPDGSLHVLTVVPGSGVWDRGRSPAGVWDEHAVKIDSNGDVSDVSAAALPDGTLHVQTVVPGSGVWNRVRGAAGAWAASATKIDENGDVSDVSAAGLPDGSLHVQTVVPGAGIWDRTRSAAGAWAGSSVKISADGSVAAISSAALPDGSLHVQSAVPGSGVWTLARGATGTWQPAPVRIDANGSVSALAAAALPDGTLHVQTVVPAYGVWTRARGAAGAWAASATKIDGNGSVLGASAAGLRDGSLHLVTLPDIEQ